MSDAGLSWLWVFAFVIPSWNLIARSSGSVTLRSIWVWTTSLPRLTVSLKMAKQTGYKVSTVDSVVWRAFADGYIESRALRVMGWERSTAKLREALKLIPPHRLKPPRLDEPHGPPSTPLPAPPPETPPSPKEVVE